MENLFNELNSINVSDKIEKKGGLSYLSWAWAWGELKKRCPEASYTVYENADGLFYHHDGKTAWVKVGVTVNGLEHVEYLPVMDMRNQSIKLENITSTAVNKSVQRALTKAIARHGLGLYIYAGEDLPEEEKPKKGKKSEEEVISFGTANSEDTDLPFDVGEEETQGTGEPVELLGLRSLMKMDGVTEEQVLKAFKGKYSAIENIEPSVIQEMLLDKWESFVKFINKGGNKK